MTENFQKWPYLLIYVYSFASIRITNDVYFAFKLFQHFEAPDPLTMTPVPISPPKQAQITKIENKYDSLDSSLPNRIRCIIVFGATVKYSVK